MKLKLLFCAILFLFLLQNVFAVETCQISSKNSDEFLLEIHVLENETALLKVQFKVPYPIECADKNSDLLAGKKISCPSAEINDALFRSLDFFIIKSNCTLTYNTQSKHLLVETISETEKIAKEADGFREIRFGKWNLIPESSGIKNTMKVILPDSSEIISFFPQQDGVMEKNTIFWREIPGEPLSIKYTRHVEEKSYLGEITLAILIIIAAIIIVKKYFSAKKFQEKLEEFNAQENAIKKELEELEVAYLRRKINDDTYTKLIMESQTKLSKIRLEKKTFLEKNKNLQ